MKIEEGCLAIVISENDDPDNGKIVRVGKFIGRYFFKGYYSLVDDLWEVDQQMTMICSAENKFLGVMNVQSESRLRRIDDLDSEEIEEYNIKGEFV